MAPEDGTTTPAGRNMAAGAGGQVLKKGPWTAAEDEILSEYVNKHGEGNWNAVQRNSGLMRCGKSCRLRWANHLRPNLKKGAFTPEEERQIIELHSKFGNKWARMALHLQGRTDNEIKNYWNTRLKRRLRAGLPIYPVDYQQQQHHHRRCHEQSLPNRAFPSSSNHANTALNSIPPMTFDPSNYQTINAPSYLPNSQCQFEILHENNGGVALSLPSRSNAQFSDNSLSPMVFFDQRFPSCNRVLSQMPKTNASFNELPSIQSSIQPSTPTCSSNIVNVMSNDGDNAISRCILRNGNSGLLEDFLVESRAFLSSQILSNENKSSEAETCKGKITNVYALMEEPENVNLELVFEPKENDKTVRDELSSGHSSIDIVLKSRSEVLNELNVSDDDFSSWLDLPTGSLQNWNNGTEVASTTEKSIDVMNRNKAREDIQAETLCSPAATTESNRDHDQYHDRDHDWALGSCC